MPESPPSSLNVSEDTDDERGSRQHVVRASAPPESDEAEDSDSSLSLPASSDDEGPTRGNDPRLRHRSLSDRVAVAQPAQTCATEGHAVPTQRPPSPPLVGTSWCSDVSVADSEATSTNTIEPLNPVNPAVTRHLVCAAPDTQPRASATSAASSSHSSPATSPPTKPSLTSPQLPSSILNSSSPGATGSQWSPSVPMAPSQYTECTPRPLTTATSSTAVMDVTASPTSVVLREDPEMEDARIRQLVELLERATTQIRAERARAKELEQENQSLRRLSSPIMRSTAVQVNVDALDMDPRYAGLQRAYELAQRRAEKYDTLKQRYRELTLENEMAVEQIAVLRIKCIDMQVALDTEKAKAQALTSKANQDPPRYSSSSPGLTLSAPVVNPHVDRQGPELIHSTTRTDGTNGDTDHGRTPNGCRKDPEGRVTRTPKNGAVGQTTRHRAPSPANTMPKAPPYGTTSPEPTGPPLAPMRSASPGRLSRSHSPGMGSARSGRGSSVPTSPKDEVLIHRMIRALSPPPTISQLAKLVDSMVKELLRNLQMRGVDLPLKRMGNCVYTLHNKRLNLSVISDKLVVKVGGGHQDLLEYLNKSKGLRPRPR